MSALDSVVTPIVHLNGTSREALLEMLLEAARKLREAIHALTAMAPNQRDYYPDPPRWPAACAQADRRMAALRGLYDELLAEYDAIERDTL